MNTNKHSRWFPADVKPARTGVYQRRWPSGIQYARWDGHHWMTSWDSPQRADLTMARSGQQGVLPWRGLAEEPKA